MNWVEGRQGSGYFKLELFRFSWIDCYILKFPTGTKVPYHRDPVPGKSHYRFNINLNKTTGGDFLCRNCIYESESGRVALFRADKQRHALTKIKGKTLYVFSIGIAIKD